MEPSWGVARRLCEARERTITAAATCDIKSRMRLDRLLPLWVQLLWSGGVSPSPRPPCSLRASRAAPSGSREARAQAHLPLQRIHTLPFFFIALAGCGGGTVIDACHAACEVQGKGTGCTAAAVDTCNGLCDFVAPQLSDCDAEAIAYFECLETKSWSCAAGGDLAISTDGKCEAETSAYTAACQQR